MPTPFVLESSVVSDVESPASATGVTIVAIHVVAMSVPAPTLVDGRPV